MDYYKRPHILATINSSASLMDVEIWNRYGNNTNTAEAAHSLVNRTGKQLKLLSAILRFVLNIFYIEIKIKFNY